MIYICRDVTDNGEDRRRFVMIADASGSAGPGSGSGTGAKFYSGRN